MDWIVIVLKIKSVANYGYSSNIFFCATDAIADDTVRYKYVKKKGYVRLHTNKGDLNIELHCDKVNTFTNVEQNQPKKWGLSKQVKKIVWSCLQHFRELQEA